MVTHTTSRARKISKSPKHMSSLKTRHTALKVAKIAAGALGAGSIIASGWYLRKPKHLNIPDPARPLDPEVIINDVEDIANLGDRNLILTPRNEVIIEEPGSPNRPGLPFNIPQVVRHMEPQLQLAQLSNSFQRIESQTNLTPQQKLALYYALGQQYYRACTPVLDQAAQQMQPYVRQGFEASGWWGHVRAGGDVVAAVDWHAKAVFLCFIALVTLLVMVFLPTLLKVQVIAPKLLQPVENIADGYGSISNFVRFLAGLMSA